METKQDVMNDVCRILGIQQFRVSTGSTEPRAFFEAVCDQIGMPIKATMDKPALAQRIIEGSGQVWKANYSSRGSTVTLTGLKAVKVAVTLFIQGRLSEDS